MKTSLSMAASKLVIQILIVVFCYRSSIFCDQALKRYICLSNETMVYPTRVFNVESFNLLTVNVSNCTVNENEISIDPKVELQPPKTRYCNDNYTM